MLPTGPRNLGKKFPPEPLTADEVRSLMNATSKRGACGVRDRALIAILYRAGLRISEALNLKVANVDMNTGVISLLKTKSKEPRRVGADSATLAYIQHWLDVRKQWKIPARSAVFCTLKGARMADVQFRQHLTFLADKAGIEKRVHPHGLRHTFASELVDERTDLRVIQDALGHQSISTTETYIRKLKNEVVVGVMCSREWEAK